MWLYLYLFCAPPRRGRERAAASCFLGSWIQTLRCSRRVERVCFLPPSLFGGVLSFAVPFHRPMTRARSRRLLHDSQKKCQGEGAGWGVGVSVCWKDIYKSGTRTLVLRVTNERGSVPVQLHSTSPVMTGKAQHALHMSRAVLPSLSKMSMTKVNLQRMS